MRHPDRDKAERVRALLAGTLAVSVVPDTLFDVSLTDEEAIRVEAARVRALLRAVEPPPAQPAPMGRTLRNEKSQPAEPAQASDAHLAVTGEAWEARLDLDRARLAFYEQPPEKRQELLTHALHQRQLAESAAASRESEDQRRARDAELARQRALEAARRARSEAERLVSEELARLLGIEQQLAELERRSEAERAALSVRRDALLGWQRRVRSALAFSGEEDADALYDAIRKTLRAAREELSSALDSISTSDTSVPAVGDDPLVRIGEVSTEAAERKRREVMQAAQRMHDREPQLRDERAAVLLEEVDQLNRARLDLLGALSAPKRAAITGFTVPGFEQARAELRHLLLILRYHRTVTTAWLASVRKPGSALGASLGNAIAVLIPWFLVVSLFFAWRKRSAPLLGTLLYRIEESDRAARLSVPSPAQKLFRFILAIHRPLEWLVLFFCLIWLLPQEAHALLEVQLVTVCVGWILAGSLLVNVINAAFAVPALAPAETQTAALRLRSLRLIGYVAVGLALILVLSARLVGHGTVYGWVLSSCWAAAILVFLVLVRWWRATVFARIGQVRRKSPFQRWALANQTGWKSLASATSAVVYLFASGVARTTRGWALRFGFARRIHAYLFKRELDKLSGEVTKAALRPLPDELFERLGPERSSPRWLQTESEPLREELLDGIRNARGGLVAVVGARGAGKTALVHALQAQVAAEGLRCVSLTASPDLTQQLMDVFRDVQEPGQEPAAVLVDDLHTQIRTCMGGLVALDALLSLARRHSQRTRWIVTLGASIWPYLQRARDTGPLFDRVFRLHPWTEEQLVQLLEDRAGSEQLTLTFEDLLDERPKGEDELERQDALQARRAGYYRLIWDYAQGNPGVALHVFRRALALDTGGLLHVGRLQTPNASELERLPDPAVFALRTLLQRTEATVEELSQLTSLRRETADELVRHALARGYLEETAGRVRITWTWLRDITRLLERRHLLVMQ